MFEHVFVVNLARRPERFARFIHEMPDRTYWPFGEPERFSAVDGSVCMPPKWYGSGPGAWGCLQSHLRLWELMLSEGWDDMLVFEDDALFPNDFYVRWRNFERFLPDDWDQFYLGGQHLMTNDHPPICEVQDRVVRCRWVNRTHAYAIRRNMVKAIYPMIAGPPPPEMQWEMDWHVDHRLSRVHVSGRWNVYAPWRFIVGQAPGWSDINGVNVTNLQGHGRRMGMCWWNQFPIVDKETAACPC